MKAKILVAISVLALLVIMLAGCMVPVMKFDVDFISDGEVVHTASTTGETISMPKNPEKQGYVFDGWYWDEGTWKKPFTINSFLDEPLSDGMKVYAKWIKECKITLDPNGGYLTSGDSAFERLEGNSYGTLPTPQRSGYTFEGWYLDRYLWKNQITEESKVTGDACLYAKWEKVITHFNILYNLDGGTVENEGDLIDKIEAKGTIDSLPEPKKQGFEFVGWTVNGFDISFPYTPASDVVFKAKWEESTKCTIYLDPNGGVLPSDVTDEIEVEIGQAIGKLPTPTRYGYEFLGWYEDGNERWQVDRRTKAEYDMEIVALWEPLENLLVVEFRLSPDESLDGDAKMYFEIIKGHRILTALNNLPTASKEETNGEYYRFLGWQDEDGNTVSLITIIENDMSLIPVWETIPFCLDGTALHDWTLFAQVSEATCTEAAVKERSCRICGWIQSEKVGEVTGHDWDSTLTIDNNGALTSSRKCWVCNKTEVSVLKSQSSSLLNIPTAEGGAYGLANVGLFYNNVFNDTVIDPKHGYFLKMTLTPKTNEPLYLDCLIFAGHGNAGTIEVTVTYSDGSTSLIGVGYTNTITQFDIEAEIIKIEIYQASTIGATYWSEIAVFTEKPFYTDELEHYIHVWSEWEIVQWGSCEQNMVQQRTCLICGDIEEEILMAEGHRFTEWGIGWDDEPFIRESTCIREGYIGRVCLECGEEERETLPMSDHVWSEWAIVSGSCVDGGTRARKCTYCAWTETEIFFPGEHLSIVCEGAYDATFDKPGSTGTKKCLDCGEILENAKTVNISNVALGATVETTSSYWGLNRELNFLVDGNRETAICSSPRTTVMNETIKLAAPSDVDKVVLVVNGKGTTSVYMNYTEITNSDYNISFVIYDESGGEIYRSQTYNTLDQTEITEHVILPEGALASSITIVRSNSFYEVNNCLWEVEVIKETYSD